MFSCHVSECICYYLSTSYVAGRSGTPHRTEDPRSGRNVAAFFALFLPCYRRLWLVTIFFGYVLCLRCLVGYRRFSLCGASSACSLFFHAALDLLHTGMYEIAHVESRLDLYTSSPPHIHAQGP